MLSIICAGVKVRQDVSLDEVRFGRVVDAPLVGRVVEVEWEDGSTERCDIMELEHLLSAL